jgi:2-amino-4-hydroxy-6-hydroxymethyldihydropteridine diphosphokinase
VTEVYFGLGSNIGNRRANLRAAIERMAPEVTIIAASDLYESEPLPAPGIDEQPAFLNTVAKVETSLAPDDLLVLVKNVERRLGRRPGVRWGPRPIDVDILIYGDEALATDALTIPHTAIRERSFVLAPLADLAPDLVPSGWQGSVRDALRRLGTGGVRRVSGPEWMS